MCEVMEELWLLQAIEAIGFCNFLFRKKGIKLDSGFILVVEDDWQARRLEEALAQNVCAQRVNRGKEKFYPKNYEIGIWRLRKYDRVSELTEFLENTDFMPILIVSGMVPEELGACTYAFKSRFNVSDIAEYDQMYQRMKNMVLQHVDHVIYELEHISTLNILKKCDVEEAYEQCFKVLVAAGKVWEMVIREKNDEQTAGIWFDKYCRCAAEALEQMDELNGLCEIDEIFARLVVQYVRQKDVSICSLKDNNASDWKRTILYSTDFYYFPESLLKIICLPIAQTVSFTQVKTELREEDILVCNECFNGNFTVKVSCSTEKGSIVRKRFLKIKKEAVMSEEGLLLEEINMIKENEEEN